MKTRLVSLTCIVFAGCLADGRDHNPPETGEVRAALKKAPDHGTSFEDVSSLLAPYSRSGGEGLGGAAWLDYNGDGRLDLYLTNGFGSQSGLFAQQPDGTFADVTVAAGVASGFGNSGVVVGDIDNDGDPDILLSGEGHLVGPAQSPMRFFRNNGNGTFADISFSSGVVGAGTAMGAAMADVDGDGFLDIFVASPGHLGIMVPPPASHPNKLYLNNGGDGTFRDVSATAGIEGLYDVPGYGTVTDGACTSGFTDYDGDGDMDILVGNCNAYPLSASPSPVRPTPFALYRNNGNNAEGIPTFTDVASAVGLNAYGFWMGLALGDVDNDGDIDFFATSTGTFMGGNFPHVLMLNDINESGTFKQGAIANTEFGWGTTMADFDNDGDLDMFQLGSLPLFGAIGPGAGNPGRLFFNDGAGNLSESAAPTGIPNLSFDYTSGVAQGDFDGDGFADLVVMRAPWADPASGVGNPNGAPLLLRNQGNGNHAITLQLVGTSSNRDAVGARVEVKTAHDRQIREIHAGSSFASSESPWPSFGIGKRDSGDVKVSWPSGLVEEFGEVQAGGLVTLVEGTGNADD